MSFGRINMSPFVILVAAFSIVSTAKVFWQLGQDVIELGKPLILKCFILGMDHIPKDMSRQWTGEINNRLFTFNGVSTCPSNYTEILEPPNSFKIFFNSTSLFNLNSPYSCRVGTMFDEKVLTVNESNFVYMPTAITTTFHDSFNGSYIFNIEKIYPKPTCYIIVGKTWLNVSMITEQKLGFLYNVTLYYQSSKEVENCGEYLSVHCIVSSRHNRLFDYDVGRLQQCESKQVSHVTQIAVTVFVTILGLPFILLLGTTICKRQELNEDKTNCYMYAAVSGKTEMENVATHIKQT